MCVFSREVASVINTKIFVGKIASQNGAKQFTVYGNQVELGAGQSAMILPLPNPGGLQGQIEVIDMTPYSDFFEDIERLYPRMRGGFGFKGISPQTTTLQVQQCGGYEFSIANTLADLDRLDWEHFEADESVKTLLQKHYATDFGFLVCKCFKSGEYAPIGIIHPSVEGRLYVPTMHEHGTQGGVAEWSHKIYALNAAGLRMTYLRTSLDQIVGAQDSRVSIGPNNLKYNLLPEGLVDVPTHEALEARNDRPELGIITRFTIDGKHGNGDLYLVDGVMRENPPPCCTFELNQDCYVLQKSYRCNTCAPAAAFLDLDLCQFCADQHTAAGHQVDFFRHSMVSCDHYGTKSVQNISPLV